MLSRFASRSARSLVAAPIQVYGVSGSYAAAAYSAAVTSGQKVIWLIHIMILILF